MKHSLAGSSMEAPRKRQAVEVPPTTAASTPTGHDDGDVDDDSVRDWLADPQLIKAMWPKLLASNLPPSSCVALLGTCSVTRDMTLRQAPHARLNLYLATPSTLSLGPFRLQTNGRTQPTTLAILNQHHPNTKPRRAPPATPPPTPPLLPYRATAQALQHVFTPPAAPLPRFTAITRLHLHSLQLDNPLLQAIAYGLPTLTRLDLHRNHVLPTDMHTGRPYLFDRSCLPRNLRTVTIQPVTRLTDPRDPGGTLVDTYASLVAGLLATNTLLEDLTLNPVDPGPHALADLTLTPVDKGSRTMADLALAPVDPGPRGVADLALNPVDPPRPRTLADLDRGPRALADLCHGRVVGGALQALVGKGGGGGVAGALRRLCVPCVMLTNDLVDVMRRAAPLLEELEVWSTCMFPLEPPVAEEEEEPVAVTWHTLWVSQLLLDGCKGLPLGGTAAGDMVIHVKGGLLSAESAAKAAGGVAHMMSEVGTRRHVRLVGGGPDGTAYVWDGSHGVGLQDVLPVLQLSQEPATRLDLINLVELHLDDLTLALASVSTVTYLQIHLQQHWHQSHHALLSQLPRHVERVCLDGEAARGSAEVLKTMVVNACKVPERRVHPLRVCVRVRTAQPLDGAGRAEGRPRGSLEGRGGGVEGGPRGPLEGRGGVVVEGVPLGPGSDLWRVVDRCRKQGATGVVMEEHWD